jgi:hypothetical protein
MKFVKLELTDCINTDTACHVALFTMIRPLADYPCGILDLLVTRQPATAVEVFHHNFLFFQLCRRHANGKHLELHHEIRTSGPTNAHICTQGESRLNKTAARYVD